MYRLLLAVLVGCVVAGDIRAGHSSSAQSGEAHMIVNQHWGRIKHSRPRDEGLYKKDRVAYWVEVMRECNREFSQMVGRAEDPDALGVMVKNFVQKFGTAGPQADMRWLLCEPGATINWGSGAGLYRAETERSRRARTVQLLLAEYMTRQFLKDRKLLNRYYQAVVWSGSTFRHHMFATHVMFLRKQFRESSEEYWWYARDFMVLAYGTGRADLLKDIEPEKLHLRFEKWSRWLHKKGPYLRPADARYRWEVDEGAEKSGNAYENFLRKLELPPLRKRPNHPFPGWQGPTPMPAKVLRELS